MALYRRGDVRPGRAGRSATCSAVLGRYDEAEIQFAQAAESSERAAAKFFIARTDLSRGTMLAARDGPGDADEARRLLGRAHEAATAYGYGNVERRSARALDRLGG